MSITLSTGGLEGKSNRSSTASLAISGTCSLTGTGGSVAYIMAWVGPDGEKAKNSNVGLAMAIADLIAGIKIRVGEGAILGLP